MSARWEIRILGDTEILRDGYSIDMGSDQRSCLLGILAVFHNRTVSVDLLTDYLWGASPPRSAKECIQSHICRIRARLSRAGAGGAVEIGTTRGGYALRTDKAVLDIVRFDELARRARQAADGHARMLYAEALGLWRGESMVGRHVGPIGVSLTEKRLLALEGWMEIRLRLGEHCQLIPDLAVHAAEHPLRPRLSAALMTALYRAGRSAEALQHYDRHRMYMSAELGLRPASELRLLQVRILRGEPLTDAG